MSKVVVDPTVRPEERQSSTIACLSAGCASRAETSTRAALVNARVAGGAALWEWIGTDDPPVFT